MAVQNQSYFDRSIREFVQKLLGSFTWKASSQDVDRLSYQPKAFYEPVDDVEMVHMIDGGDELPDVFSRLSLTQFSSLAQEGHERPALCELHDQVIITSRLKNLQGENSSS